MVSSRAQVGGGFVLSLDFELMWGVKGSHTPESYGACILAARAAIPHMLELFARYRIACTWAMVGMLLFDRRDALMAALPGLRPRYGDARIASYSYLAGLGPDEASDPLHFALSLAHRIAACPRQEIATHTFSHYYCLEAPLDPAAFAADLAAARAAAAQQGWQTRSIVFPRNQHCPAALEVCRRQGLTAYRGAGPHWFDQPVPRRGEGLLRRAARATAAYAPLRPAGAVQAQAARGMVNVPASRFFRPHAPHLPGGAAAQRFSIRRAMRQAARQGRIFHLWFHPHNFGAHTETNLAMFEAILQDYARLRAETGWPSLTMADAARGAGAMP